MSEDVWSERDTTPSRVEAALRDLLVQRHRTSEGYVPARVLNAVVIVDDDFHGEIENRLRTVGRFHPSRLIVCRVRKGHETLDAIASITGDDAPPEPGKIAVVHERVSLLMGPQHLRGFDTVVDPLVVSDIATMIWSPHGHDNAVESLRRLAQVVLLDSQDDPSVAAAFDAPKHRPALGAIEEVTVRHRHDSAAAAVLFCGWLSSRLGWRPEELLPRDGGFLGHARAPRADVALRCEATEVGAPGLGGVTIRSAGGEAVSLDRGPGGLREHRRERDGT